jgi:transposase
MWRRTERANLEKKPSMRLSQEPCLGVKVNSKGPAGRVQMGWYDRQVRRVRDLSCGDTRIFLELEVRRVDCGNCGNVKRERLERRPLPPRSLASGLRDKSIDRRPTDL